MADFGQPEFEYLGPYQVERILGRGGMGTVYKGVHARSGEQVAIKVIASGVANQSRFRRRFASEVETLQRLKHPNIVTLSGYGEEQGLLFYSMEYVDGHSLHEHLRQHSRLDWDEAVDVGIQVAGALKHAHDLGIIHRDLKPANLMLNSSGQVKLTDFGIAKLFGSADMTAAGSVIGTADYMPPEQAEGKGVTARSDLYSLGGVLYALLCGKPPFGGKSVPEVLYAVRYNPVPSLQNRVEDVPEELCELIHELLEKDPQKRPPTALVVGNRLRALQEGMKRETGLELKKPSPTNAPQVTVEPQEPVGTQLTSLDLSDVEDDEIRLMSDGGAEKSETDDQETMLAPEQQSASVEDNDAHAEMAGATDLTQESKARISSPASRDEEFDEDYDERDLTSGGPSHYTPIDESQDRPFTLSSNEEEQADGVDWLQYASIGGMIAALLAAIGFGWWMLQPRDATQIYESIMLAVDSGDDGQLLSAKGDMEEFLQRFPNDERVEEVKAFADDIELTRWSRILKRRAARQGGRDELSVVEQGFLDCMEAREENGELAKQKLQAFIAVFGPLDNLTKSEERLLELAQYAVSINVENKKEDPLALTQLADLIRAAESSLSGKRLESYYQQIILLYADKDWASDQIQRIRVKMEAESKD